MCRSIYRFSVISSLIFPLVVFNVSASPCFRDNSVTKGTQMISKLPRDKDCNDSDSSSRKSVSEKNHRVHRRETEDKSRNYENRS